MFKDQHVHEDSVPIRSSKYFRKTSFGYLEKLAKTLGKLHTFEPKPGISAYKALLKNNLVVRETHKRNKSHLNGPAASSA